MQYSTNSVVYTIVVTGVHCVRYQFVFLSIVKRNLLSTLLYDVFLKLRGLVSRVSRVVGDQSRSKASSRLVGEEQKKKSEEAAARADDTTPAWEGSARQHCTVLASFLGKVLYCS